MRGSGTAILAALALGCGGPPQRKDEAAVTYRAAFTSEAGVSAKVVFPFPTDAASSRVRDGLSVSGGTAQVEQTSEGTGLAVEGKGRVEATFQADRVAGLGEGGVPEAAISRLVPDGGTAALFRVNKGGSALLPVELEYTASRDCGAGCGGRRSWKMQELVGLGLQEVQLEFSEEQNR